MAHILVDTTVCVCWTELGQKLPWNKLRFENIWKWKWKFQFQFQFIYLPEKKTHIHTDIQYITKMLLKD